MRDDGLIQRRQEIGIRKILALLAQMLSPHSGTCKCCGLPWTVVGGHSTRYSKNHGCFPLCEKCWRAFGCEERLPYYRQLYDEWERMGYDEAEWSDIEAAG